jgi:hypothetical protein
MAAAIFIFIRFIGRGCSNYSKCQLALDLPCPAALQPGTHAKRSESAAVDAWGGAEFVRVIQGCLVCRRTYPFAPFVPHDGVSDLKPE